jgi:hypothetical protein
MKYQKVIDTIRLQIKRRGGRVAEGAPLLRRFISEVGTNAKLLALYVASTDTFVNLKERLNYSLTIPRKSHVADWHTVQDVYDTLVQVLDCKTRNLAEPLPDELGELRDTLVDMQLAHRGTGSKINSDSVGV